MYFDWTYLVFVLPAMIFALWASANVNNVYNQYKTQYNSKNITGMKAARFVLDSNGLKDVRIEMIQGDLTDHYDPKDNVIRLSQNVYSSASTAAVGVACHEAGHAIQYADEYVPIKLRTAIIPVTNIGSKLSVPLIIIGLLLGYLSETFFFIAYVGVACFALSTLFQLITLPTEFDASRRAVKCIEEGQLLVGDELSGTKKVLRAAALTYVAALAVSVMQLLRLVIIVGGRNRRK